MAQVTVSIVCFNTRLDIITKCIACVENQEVDWQGVFVDHSPNSEYKNLFQDRKNWIYLERGDVNDGFGGGNNFAFLHAPPSKYHLLVNPDLSLEKNAIKLMLSEIKRDSQIGVLTGKVSYPNGQLQKLNKRNPNVFALLGRRFPFVQRLPIILESIRNYEMNEFNYEVETDVEFISGCWMMIPCEIWKKVNGFDTRFFLYFEDADLTRKIRTAGYKTVYSPIPEAMHEYQRGSHKSLKLFIVFLRSMILYFHKWGWQWK